MRARVCFFSLSLQHQHGDKGATINFTEKRKREEKQADKEESSARRRAAAAAAASSQQKRSGTAEVRAPRLFGDQEATGCCLAGGLIRLRGFSQAASSGITPWLHPLK